MTVIAGFWWRSMPAHDEGLTLAISAALLFALYAGMTSWWTARTRLRTPLVPRRPLGPALAPPGGHRPCPCDRRGQLAPHRGQRTGTPLPLDAPYFDGHPLAGRR